MEGLLETTNEAAPVFTHRPYPSGPWEVGVGLGGGAPPGVSPSLPAGGPEGEGEQAENREGGPWTHRQLQIGFFHSRSLNLYLHTVPGAVARNRMYQQKTSKSTFGDEEVVVGSHLKSEQRKKRSGRSIPQTTLEID